MNLYKAERAAVTALFILYIACSQFILPLINKREIYPFFQWSLFSLINVQGTEQMKIPEMEIFLPEGGRLTNRDFPPVLSRDFYQTADRIAVTRNEREKTRRLARLMQRANQQMDFSGTSSFKAGSEKAKPPLLQERSGQEGSVASRPLHFILYESYVNLLEYAKTASVKKEALRARGVFFPATGKTEIINKGLFKFNGRYMEIEGRDRGRAEGGFG